MKKNMLLVLIGLVFGVAGTVIASNYLASDVVYNDTTVESALNDLYDRSNSTLDNLNNRISSLEQSNSTLTSQISSLEETNNTLTSENDRLTNEINVYYDKDCTSGSVLWDQTKVNNGYSILNYKPSTITLFGSKTNNGKVIRYFNNNINNSKVFIFDDAGAYSEGNITDSSFKIESNKVTIKLSSSYLGQTIYFVACK